MSNIINTLKGYISPDLVAQTSSNLGENTGNVTAALSSAFPSILGGLLNKSSDPKAMGGFLDVAKRQGEASPGNLTDDLRSWHGSGLLDKGKNMIGALFGNKSNEVADAIGSSSGIKSSSAGSILAIAAPMVMSFFAHKAKSDNWGVSNMVGFLKEQKGNIVNAMPAGVSNILGGKAEVVGGARHASEHVHEAKSTNWIKYIIYIAIAGLLFFVLSRSCSKNANQNEVTPYKNAKPSKGTQGSFQFNLNNSVENVYEVIL